VQYARTRLRALVVAALAVAIAGTTATAANAAPSTSDINKKIDAASNQLEDVTESYNKMKIGLDETVAEEKKLAASLGPAKTAMDAATAQMGTIAASAYMQGTIGAVNVLLEGNDGMLERMSYLDQLSRARQRDIAAYQSTTQDYSARQAALKATQDKQAAQVKVLADRKKKIKSDLDKLYAMRSAAYGSPTSSGGAHNAKAPAVSGAAGKAVSYAFAAYNRGAMYQPLGDGPDTYDCSGLTMAAWNAAGKSLPHNAAEQDRVTAPIGRDQLQPGDLIFYRSDGHVALYVGGGKIIDASKPGTPVNYRTMDIMTPYAYGRVK
jgi:peptidoglycan DL-endopeptidase CwlO